MTMWRRLSRAALASGSWYNSTNAAGGNSPVLTVAESRKASRKFESSLDWARLPAFSSTSNELPVERSSQIPTPCCRQPTTVAAPMIPFMSRGHIMKQKRWALVRATVALAKASSRWDCLSSGESSWKLYPRPPVRNPILVCARSTCCAVIPAHDVTPLEITLPSELATQTELLSAPDISFLLWRTAKHPFSPASNSTCSEIQLIIWPMSPVAWITLWGDRQKTGK